MAKVIRTELILANKSIEKISGLSMGLITLEDKINLYIDSKSAEGAGADSSKEHFKDYISVINQLKVNINNLFNSMQNANYEFIDYMDQYTWENLSQLDTADLESLQKRLDECNNIITNPEKHTSQELQIATLEIPKLEKKIELLNGLEQEDIKLYGKIEPERINLKNTKTEIDNISVSTL